VVFEQIAGGFGDAGGVAAHVDDGIEVFTHVDEGFDFFEPIACVWVSIADESTDRGRQAGIGC